MALKIKYKYQQFLSNILEIKNMIPNQIKDSIINPFATPPSKKFLSPKSIVRKPSFVNFNKKKNTDIQEIKPSQRMRFISATKANLYMNDESSLVQQSISINYTQYSQNQPINYPFIKRCVSPRHFSSSISQSPKQNLTQYKHKNISQQQSPFSNTILSPSIQDFSKCTQLSQQIFNPNALHQQIKSLKKLNFDLNILVDQKNEQIQRQKLSYDSKLNELSQEILQIKNSIQDSQKKLEQTQSKLTKSQSKCKELEGKLKENNQKLQKAIKEIKMYKSKFRVGYGTTGNGNNSTKEMKQNQENKAHNKKYHQNCCKKGENHNHSHNHNHPTSNKCLKTHQNNSNKLNTLVQSRNKQPSNNNQTSNLTIKKIKSQILLPQYTPSIQTSPQTSKLMKIHSNQQDFIEYSQFKLKIQNLVDQIKYKDIQILTLKKVKCQFQKQKFNYQKIKKFNKKLLARVEFLTKQFDELENTKRLSLPSQIQMTPKKGYKASKQQQQYKCQQLNDSQEEQQAHQLFELSPQKYFNDQDSTINTDIIVQQQFTY